VPPMIIYKGKRVTDGLKKNMPDGTEVVMTNTGYMNMDLFQKWLEHFKKNLQDPNSPALLILDGHGAHVKGIGGLKYAEQNQISTLPGTKVLSLSTSGFGFFIPIDRSRRALQASDVSISNFGTLRKLLAF